MPEELRTPDEEPKLLAAEHGGYFFLYRDAPKVELEEVDGAKISLIYDGSPRPCLTVDFEGARAIVDVEAATVEKGVLREDLMAEILEYTAANRDVLAEMWAEFHADAGETRLELEAIASELTDPNDIELDDDGFDDDGPCLSRT